VRRSFASAPGRRVSAGVAQLIIVAVLGALAIAPEALAEATGAAALKSEQQALLKRAFKEPANLDVAFRYAEVSTQLNDFEAAIGALERMLFFNAKLPRVQLELGVLYFRLGSYEMAKSYFTTGALTPYWLYALGGLFIAVTLFLPMGIVGTLRHYFAQRRAPPSGAEDPTPNSIAPNPEAAE